MFLVKENSPVQEKRFEIQSSEEDCGCGCGGSCGGHRKKWLLAGAVVVLLGLGVYLYSRFKRN